MSIKEFNYITKEGDNTPRTVFVLEEDANYIKGIDLTHVDKTVKEEIIRTFNYLDSIISNNMDSFRSFKVNSIVENWYAYIKKDNIIVSKFAPKSYAHKMTIEEVTAKGIQQKQALIRLLEDNKDKQLYLERHGKDIYKRTLGVIYLDDLNVNKYMLESGNAMEYIYKKK